MEQIEIVTKYFRIKYKTMKSFLLKLDLKSTGFEKYRKSGTV